MTPPNNQTLKVSGATDCEQVSYLTTECKSAERESTRVVSMRVTALWCEAAAISNGTAVQQERDRDCSIWIVREI